MRKPALLCALALTVAGACGVAASASLASSRALDDGCLVTRDAYGVITLNIKGFVFGQFDQGQLTLDDPFEGDGVVKVYGAEKVRATTGTRTTYIGQQVRFRAAGRTIIRINAVGVYLSAVGRGTATLFADTFLRQIAGDFSVDAESFCADKFQDMPDLAPQRFAIGGPG